MKKVLILGSSGMLGHVAMLRLEELGYQVWGISKSRQFGKRTILLDLGSTEDFNDFLKENEFDVIVNAAALLVSQSEQYKAAAVCLNSYLPNFLEERFRCTATKIIHVSTDGVFSGKRAPYFESSVHDSEHFYGRTKSLGEIKNDKDLTVRSAFWGPELDDGRNSLLQWILYQNNTVRGFINHIFNGVSSLFFANFLFEAIQHNLTGVVHLVAKYPISKYDFLLSVKEIFDLKNEIIPIEAQAVDRTLVNSRSDIFNEKADYREMLEACKEWILNRQELYPHCNVRCSKQRR